MLHSAIKKGTTSKRLRVFIYDASKSDGRGLTGLAWNSSGLTWYYLRDGDSNETQVTLATASLGTWASGGFVQVDATNMPGWYEIGVPNAVLASGAGDVQMLLFGATNMVPVPVHIQLIDNELGVDPLTTNPTTYTDAATVGGQIRRTHALVGGNKQKKDHSAANPTWKSRNEADSADLVTQTRTVSGSMETITPS